jgi:hypothetical protein
MTNERTEVELVAAFSKSLNGLPMDYLFYMYLEKCHNEFNDLIDNSKPMEEMKMRFRAGITYADTRLQIEEIRDILENALNANQCPIDLDDKWPRSNDNSVRDKGVFWLYCWATTGVKSHDAAAIAASRRIFNAIFNFADELAFYLPKH